MSNAKFLGNSDEVTTCDCCGRSDLKSTVGLELESGEIVHYGVTCAAHALLIDVKTVKSCSRKADNVKADRDAAVARRARTAADEPWFTFLARSGSGSDTFTRIESLGGYKAARAAFEASR